MNEYPTYYNDLISKYFSGETSDKEAAELLLWVQENEENARIFDDFRKTWLAIEEQSVKDSLDIDEEWERFSKICFSETGNELETKVIQADFSAKRRKKLLVRYMSAAAVIAVLAVSSWLIGTYVFHNKELTLIAQAENVDQILSDGSQVTLSPGTRITYREKFEKDRRDVMLEGEAYFEVTHDPSRPFTVSVGDNICIEVVGTSFYVNTHNKLGNVEVMLMTGKVAVYYKDQPLDTAFLLPGEKAELSPIHSEIAKFVPQDMNFLAWKTGKLVFNETSLDEVLNLLKKTYHADVRLADPELASCTITATFNNQSLESVMKVISETLGLEIKKRTDYYEISGPACQ